MATPASIPSTSVARASWVPIVANRMVPALKAIIACLMVPPTYRRCRSARPPRIAAAGSRATRLSGSRGRIRKFSWRRYSGHKVALVMDTSAAARRYPSGASHWEHIDALARRIRGCQAAGRIRPRERIAGRARACKFPLVAAELGSIPEGGPTCGGKRVEHAEDAAIMSRAFVKETDATVEELPERPISPHPNFVTAEGLALIEATLARLQREHAAAQAASDRAVLAKLARDLRYWTSRRTTAQVIAPPSNSSEVQFGCTVTIRREDGRRQTYRIVGEDEADPSRGTISYVSPVARALTGKKLGDVARAGTSDVEVIEIRS